MASNELLQTSSRGKKMFFLISEYVSSSFQTPFEELAKYQSQTFSKSSGGQDELVISFDTEAGFGGSGPGSSASRIVSDRVRAASAAYAAHLDKVERGGPSISDGMSPRQHAK